MTSAELIRKTVSENLHRARMNAELPGLSGGKRGKVRHVYHVSDEGRHPLVIISTSDRVSVFNVVQNRAVPFKGAVLNAISRWAFEHTKDIIPNALVESPTPHIMIQKELTNIGIECIVRGYLWGNLATDYERCVGIKCGLPLKDGLWRYQKLDSPIFTPTTKADQGHDQDITLEQMAPLMEKKLRSAGIEVTGHDLADRVQDVSLRLYDRGGQLAGQAGLLMVDTKYEFGLDLEGRLYVIDEIHTPDSSRYVKRSEWEEKWPLIRDLMATGEWKKVSQLLIDHPELKISELSKQLIRDVLLERGYDPKNGPGPSLRDEDIIETAARYIELYEHLTGNQFDFEIDQLDHLDINSVVRRCSRSFISET